MYTDVNKAIHKNMHVYAHLITSAEPLCVLLLEASHALVDPGQGIHFLGASLRLLLFYAHKT
jgi:hypothetical protein